jgi:hypothetical protein
MGTESPPEEAHNRALEEARRVSRYTGSSGEYFVASHLLRLRLNTAPLPIDDGIDLLGHRHRAHGDSEIYLFQVKTSVRDLSTINFTAAQFDRLLDQAVNLVIVMWRSPDDPVALVLPPRLLRMMTTGGHADPRAPIRRGGPRVHLRVERREGHIYVRNRAHDFTGMANRFDLCESTDVEVAALPEYATFSWQGQTVVQLDPDIPGGNENSLGGAS